jgi:hypothetical protein
VYIVAPAGFHARQGSHRTFFNPVLGRNPPCEFLLVRPAATQILHWAASRRYGFKRSPFDDFAHLLCVCAKIFEQNLIGPQIALQSERVGDLSQSSSNHQSIESIQNPSDLASVGCGKLLHAFLLVIKVFLDNSQ